MCDVCVHVKDGEARHMKRQWQRVRWREESGVPFVPSGQRNYFTLLTVEASPELTCQSLTVQNRFTVLCFITCCTEEEMRGRMKISVVSG